MKPTISRQNSEGLVLRSLRADDLPVTLEWRNRPDVRKWFKTSDELTWDQHQNWFESYIQKTNDYTFIAEMKSKAVGQLAVYAIDESTRSAEVGRFISAPAFAGKGYMKNALALLKVICREDLGLEMLSLEVISNNARAISLYRRSGFSEVGSHENLTKMKCPIRDGP